MPSPSFDHDVPDPMLDEVIGAFVAALGPGALTEFALTSLDRVDVPVWQVWWEEERSATGGIGYGLTEQRARVGALGECVENVSALRALRGAPRASGSYADLLRRRDAGGVVDPRLLGLPAGADFTDERPLQWLPMRRLQDGAEVLVPAEFVASTPGELLGEAPRDGWLTTPVSNGLGAGSSLEQATAHAVLEIVQRDGNGLAFRALDRGMVLALDDVSDEITLAALERLAAAGVQVLAKLASTDFGLPNVYVVGTAAGDDILSATACGEAVHPDREVALRKAVLEFANARARKQFMHGPLDRALSVAPPGYRAVIDATNPADQEQRVLAAMVTWLGLGEPIWRPLLDATVLRRDGTVPFSSLPTAAPSNAAELLADVADRLRGNGFDILVADFSPPDHAGVHAVKVVVPGLEVETVAYGRIGERNTRRLLTDGRDDLVRVGSAPPGWAQVHLSADAEARLGGPAWLDRAALDRVADGLLPLYREPGRHTAQRVLAAER